MFVPNASEYSQTRMECWWWREGSPCKRILMTRSTAESRHPAVCSILTAIRNLLCLSWFCVCLQSDLHGVLPVAGGQFLSLQRDALRWPNGLKQAAAVCNSLTLIDKKQVVGELEERQAFNAVEACFLASCHTQTCHPRIFQQVSSYTSCDFCIDVLLLRQQQCLGYESCIFAFSASVGHQLKNCCIKALYLHAHATSM